RSQRYRWSCFSAPPTVHRGTHRHRTPEGLPWHSGRRLSQPRFRPRPSPRQMDYPESWLWLFLRLILILTLFLLAVAEMGVKRAIRDFNPVSVGVLTRARAERMIALLAGITRRTVARLHN